MPAKSAKKPWGAAEVAAWWQKQRRVKSYTDTVIRRIYNLPRSDTLHVEKYGTLAFNPAQYPLFRVRVGAWDNAKPNILITGGVHGYEYGGINAALTFLEQRACRLKDEFNIVVYPCVSPLSLEYGIRWNQNTQDTNRHFCRDANQTESGRSAEECVAFMNSVDRLSTQFALHVDLHETINSGVKRFHQEKKDRDGDSSAANTIAPQGFFLVMNAGDESSGLGLKIIETVRKVTAIAPEPTIMSTKSHDGVIYLSREHYPGLCMNFTNATHKVTTEVCPDMTTSHKAIAGHLAAIHGALEHLRKN